MKHQWKTGRDYDQHGQRMVAMVERQKLLFSDLSRNIDGVVPLGVFMLGRDLSNHAIETLVMANYDFGNYSPSNTTLEWKD